MYYYLYEIKNKINGKIYVGVHKTLNLNDDYMGSGKILNQAFSKYGKENFEKTIIEFFNNSDEMFAKEKTIVTEEFLQRSDVYNLRRGGTGGFDYINKNGLQKIARKNANKTLKQKYGDTFLSQLGKIGSQKQIANGQREISIERLKNYPGWKNELHKQNALSNANSPEAISKKKQTWAKNQRGKGIKNSQFGTMWITNGHINKKITKTDPVPRGWRPGRVI